MSYFKLLEGKSDERLAGDVVLVKVVHLDHELRRERSGYKGVVCAFG